MTEFKPIKEGKVREIYDNGDSLIMVATDRISAFDVKRRDAVGGNHDEAVAVVIDLTNLAFFNGLELSHNQNTPFSNADRAAVYLTPLLYHFCPAFERNRMKGKRSGFCVFLVKNAQKTPVKFGVLTTKVVLSQQ